MVSKKRIRRALEGTCIPVPNGGPRPSRVTVSVQRPRGGCLWLGTKKKRVATFAFDEGRRADGDYCHAVLDLEQLFRFSSKADPQVKISVQLRGGGKRVARLHLDDFLGQLLSTGRAEWFFLYVHQHMVKLWPGSCSSPSSVPEWHFEELAHDSQRYSKGQGKDRHEEALLLDAVNVTTVNGHNEPSRGQAATTHGEDPEEWQSTQGIIPQDTTMEMQDEGTDNTNDPIENSEKDDSEHESANEKLLDNEEKVEFSIEEEETVHESEWYTEEEYVLDNVEEEESVVFEGKALAKKNCRVNEMRSGAWVRCARRYACRAMIVVVYIFVLVFLLVNLLTIEEDLLWDIIG